MRVYFTRDSVCAGDDGDAPHAREIDIAEPLDARSLVRNLLAVYSLPSIQGGNATWCVSSGVPLAVMAQEWSEPKMLSSFPMKLSLLDVRSGVVRLHFSYFAQMDPEVVYDVLRRLRVQAE